MSLAVAGALLAAAGAAAIGWGPELGWDGLRTVSDSHAGLAFLVIVSLMVAHNFVPVPAEVVAVLAGAVLGPALGFLAVWCGAMLGAALAFWIARRWGRAALRWLLAGKYPRHLDLATGRRVVTALLLARLVPVISFNLVNYSAGLTRVPWPAFLGTTAVGIIPMTALSVGVGANVAFVSGAPAVVLAVALAAVVALVVFRRRT